MKFLIGKKLGMTTLFDPEKGALNMTLIEVEKNTVALHRTRERDGYSAIAITAPKTSRKNVTREFRLDKGRADADKIAQAFEAAALGTELSVEQFSAGEKVHVSGVTKAKGFQGVVKRHGFHGAPASHGRKHDMRKPGSIGATFPEHVIKGRRMAGRMGGENFTVRNLAVVYVDAEKGLLGVRGAVPGGNGTVVTVASA